MLILSGLPLELFAGNLDRQLADKPELRQAVAECDWAVMRDQLGVSCGYLKDAVSRPSGFTPFAHLARARSPARLLVFQGNSDVNTPASFTHQLEEWNGATGHLDLVVHYYDSGHSGTPEVARTTRRSASGSPSDRRPPGRPVTARLDLLAEALATTSSVPTGATGGEGGTMVAPEASGGEIVGLLGFRYQVVRGLFVSTGVTFDNNDALLLRQGLTWKFDTR